MGMFVCMIALLACVPLAISIKCAHLGISNQNHSGVAHGSGEEGQGGVLEMRLYPGTGGREVAWDLGWQSLYSAASG